jgi:hypothetical protein
MTAMLQSAKAQAPGSKAPAAEPHHVRQFSKEALIGFTGADVRTGWKWS